MPESNLNIQRLRLPSSPSTKTVNLKLLRNSFAIFIAACAHAQDPVDLMTTALGDVAAIKQRAEAGDTVAQVALGKTPASNFRAVEALQWYRRAAAQGNTDGKYHVGHMLLFGAPGIPSNLSVQPNQTEGVHWTFLAATNLHAYACWDMAKALRQGLGTETNLVAAYAWLQLFSETSPGSIVGRVEMNQLALKLDTVALQRAQNLVAEFKAGHWQMPVTRTIPEDDARLKLGGITFGARKSLAVINGKTLTEGESANISLRPGTLKIRCLKIEQDSVLIAVEGENAPRLLHLK